MTVLAATLGTTSLGAAGTPRGAVGRASQHGLVHGTHYCNGCTPPLIYLGGPVMTTNTSSGLTITPIYWAPAGSSFPASYESILDGYITNLAAASQSATNVYSIDTEYYDTTNGVKTYVTYNFKAGTPVIDTDPYPSNGCTPSGGNATCITDSQIRTELAKITQSHGLRTTLADFYPVFFPPKVETQDRDRTNSVSSFCGYHRAFASGSGEIVYANLPYEPTGCDGGQRPNGSYAADGAVSTLSHELNESVTDPDPTGKYAWNDSTGNEIGDICGEAFGPPLGLDVVVEQVDDGVQPGDQWGQVLHAGGVLGPRVQEARRRRGMSAERVRRSAPHRRVRERGGGDLLGQLSGGAGVEREVQERGSCRDHRRLRLRHRWRPRQLLRVPVLERGAVRVPQQVCGDHGRRWHDHGHVHHGDEQRDLLDCCDRGGRGALLGVVHLPRCRSEARADRLGLVPLVARGGCILAPVRRDVQESIRQALHATRVDVTVFPGASTSKAVKASQVTLTASTTGPNGTYTTVPLSGSTGGGQAITGYVGPEQGSTLEANGRRRCTSKSTLNSDVPLSQATPLIGFEDYLDQVDSASGSGATLADTLATNVTVDTAAPAARDLVVRRRRRPCTRPGGAAVRQESVEAPALGPESHGGDERLTARVSGVARFVLVGDPRRGQLHAQRTRCSESRARRWRFA